MTGAPWRKEFVCDFILQYKTKMCPPWILCFLFNLITKGSKVSYWKARVISIYRVSYAAPRFVRTCSWGKVSSDWSPCPDLRSSGGILAELWGRTVIWGPLLWFAFRGTQGEGPDHQGDTGGHRATGGHRRTLEHRGRGQFNWWRHVIEAAAWKWWFLPKITKGPDL